MAAHAHPDRPAAEDPLAPDEEPGGAAPAPGDHPATRRIVAAVALLFLLGPGLAILAGHGGRPLAREVKARTPAPSRGWRFFDDASLYLTQRLPYRHRAVDANTWISKHVFGTTPNYGNNAAGTDRALPFGGARSGAGGGYAQNGGALSGHAVVAVGRGHWDFLQGEIDTLCHAPVPPATALARWRSFVDILRRSGRRAALIVVPEKSTVYPERIIPAATPSWACAELQKARLWREIERHGGTEVIGLRRPLLALKKRRPGALLYLPLDSHWNDAGALTGTRAGLHAVGAGVQVAPGDVRAGSGPYVGDIAAFGGGPTRGIAPTRTIVRPGEGPGRLGPSPGGAVSTRGAGSAKVIPRTTLFLHDSFGDRVDPQLRPYAARLLIASFLPLRPPQIVKLLRSAHTVLIETSERDFLDRAAPGLEQTVLTPAFLAALPAELAPR